MSRQADSIVMNDFLYFLMRENSVKEFMMYFSCGSLVDYFIKNIVASEDMEMIHFISTNNNNSLDNQIQQVTQEAVFQDKLQIVTVLLSYHKTTYSMVIEDVLTAACYEKNMRIIKYLFENHSSDINHSRNIGWNLGTEGNAAVYNLYKFYVPEISTYHKKILFSTVASEATEIIDIILRSDPTMTWKHLIHGVTLSVHFDNVECIKTILRYIPDIDFNRNAMLYHAIKRGHIKLVKLLVQHGANYSGHGRSPIHAAVKYKRYAILDYLLSIGGKVNPGLRYGDTITQNLITKYKPIQQCEYLCRRVTGWRLKQIEASKKEERMFTTRLLNCRLYDVTIVIV